MASPVDNNRQMNGVNKAPLYNKENTLAEMFAPAELHAGCSVCSTNWDFETLTITTDEKGHQGYRISEKLMQGYKLRMTVDTHQIGNRKARMILCAGEGYWYIPLIPRWNNSVQFGYLPPDSSDSDSWELVIKLNDDAPQLVKMIHDPTHSRLVYTKNQTILIQAWWEKQKSAHLHEMWARPSAQGLWSVDTYAGASR